MAKTRKQLAVRINLTETPIKESRIVDDSTQHEWEFMFDGTDLILQTFIEYKRANIHDAWQLQENGKRFYQYSREYSTLDVKEVPFPFDLAQDIKKRFLALCAQVKVKRDTTA